MVSQHMSAFLKKLKNTIINNELDLDMIFSHFDTDGNNSLDLKEFTQFIKVVYMKADPEDIKDAFKTLDTSGDKFIQIEEFKNLLR
jgi:Ca2+-binding EF-hand superfamily protein